MISTTTITFTIATITTTIITTTTITIAATSATTTTTITHYKSYIHVSKQIKHNKKPMDSNNI